jgi:hypothetical protein
VQLGAILHQSTASRTNQDGDQVRLFYLRFRDEGSTTVIASGIMVTGGRNPGRRGVLGEVIGALRKECWVVAAVSTLSANARSGVGCQPLANRPALTRILGMPFTTRGSLISPRAIEPRQIESVKRIQTLAS